MPTYEYICSKCDHHFETIQSISHAALKICPKDQCGMKTKWGKGKVKRAISGGAGFLFKGSGFYITDYRSDKYKEAAKKDSAPAPAAGGTSKPAESKPTPASGAKTDAKT